MSEMPGRSSMPAPVLRIELRALVAAKLQLFVDGIQRKLHKLPNQRNVGQAAGEGPFIRLALFILRRLRIRPLLQRYAAPQEVLARLTCAPVAQQGAQRCTTAAASPGPSGSSILSEPFHAARMLRESAPLITAAASPQLPQA